MATDLQLIPGTLPSGFCPTGNDSLQQLNQEIITRAVARFPDNINTFNYGNDEPSPENRDRPWFRTKSDGSPDRWYVYFNGSWVSPHPIPANDSRIVMWEGAEADIAGIDLNGNATASVGDATGPFWEKVDTFDGRMPIGPGTLPDSGDTLSVGDTGGEDEHTQTEDELAQHRHLLLNQSNDVSGVSDLFPPGGSLTDPAGATVAALGLHGGAVGDDTEYALAGVDKDSSDASVGISGSKGTSEPMNNLPPYRAVFFIRRTARKFYTPSDAP